MVKVSDDKIIEAVGSIPQTEFPDFFCCPICMSIVFEPKECKRCNILICQNCITTLILTSSSQCPKCRSDQGFQNMNLLIRQVFESTKFKGCPLEGCTYNEEIQLHQLLSHFKSECQSLQVLCPLLCGQYFDRSQASDHYFKCSKNLAECKKCKFQQTWQLWNVDNDLTKSHDCLKIALEKIDELRQMLIQSVNTVNELQGQVRNLQNQVDGLKDRRQLQRSRSRDRDNMASLITISNINDRQGAQSTNIVSSSRPQRFESFFNRYRPSDNGGSGLGSSYYDFFDYDRDNPTFSFSRYNNRQH